MAPSGGPPRGGGWADATLYATAAAILAAVHCWMTARQGAPYMDELYHGPQAARHCAAAATSGTVAGRYGRAVWPAAAADAAITTPPGVYIPPAAVVWVAGVVGGVATRVGHWGGGGGDDGGWGEGLATSVAGVVCGTAGLRVVAAGWALLLLREVLAAVRQEWDDGTGWGGSDGGSPRGSDDGTPDGGSDGVGSNGSSGGGVIDVAATATAAPSATASSLAQASRSPAGARLRSHRRSRQRGGATVLPPSPLTASPLASREDGMAAAAAVAAGGCAATTREWHPPVVLPRLAAVAISLTPCLAFYAPFFYTDVAAAALSVATLRTARAGRHGLSAVAAAAAATTRQTAVVWHIYAAGGAAVATAARLVRMAAAPADVAAAAAAFAPHAVVAAGYATFWVANGGRVALGATAAADHTATTHWAMVAYAAAAWAVTWAPLVAREAAGVAAAAARGQLGVVTTAAAGVAVATAGAGAAVAAGTRVHPYVLADNRHYAFYFARRVLGVAVRRVATVPVYGVAAAAAMSALRGGPAAQGGGGGRGPAGLGRVVTVAHLLLLLAAVTAVLVPTPLMEGRYLGPPVVMWALAVVRAELAALRRWGAACSRGGAGGAADVNRASRTAVCWYTATVVYLLVVNGALLWIFLERPFPRAVDAHMLSDISPGRFML